MQCKFMVSILALAMSASAGAQAAAPAANVPDNLKPSAGESVAMIVAAKGVQIYECRQAKNQADAYEWTFVAPLAELFDAGCSQTALGTVVRVPYTADYYFLAAKDDVPSQVNAVANPVVQPRSSYSY